MDADSTSSEGLVRTGARTTFSTSGGSMLRVSDWVSHEFCVGLSDDLNGERVSAGVDAVGREPGLDLGPAPDLHALADHTRRSGEAARSPSSGRKLADALGGPAGHLSDIRCVDQLVVDAQDSAGWQRTSQLVDSRPQRGVRRAGFSVEGHNGQISPVLDGCVIEAMRVEGLDLPVVLGVEPADKQREHELTSAYGSPPRWLTQPDAP